MAALQELAQQLVNDGPIKTEPTPRRVRGLYKKKFIFETISAVYVWEHTKYPWLYIPANNFVGLQKGDQEFQGPKGTAKLGIITDGDNSLKDLVVFESGELQGLVRVDFKSIDSWFIEDEEIYVHPKDPFKRIDTFSSSREVQVIIDGVEIAKSSQNIFLFETSLPARYYLPQTSVNWEYLTESKTVSRCPYKGEANYYNVTVGGKEYKDVIWWYRYPTAESILVAGRLSFYNEKVDIYIDGIQEVRPKTHFV